MNIESTVALSADAAGSSQHAVQAEESVPKKQETFAAIRSTLDADSKNSEGGCCDCNRAFHLPAQSRGAVAWELM